MAAGAGLARARQYASAGGHHPSLRATTRGLRTLGRGTDGQGASESDVSDDRLRPTFLVDDAVGNCAVGIAVDNGVRAIRWLQGAVQFGSIAGTEVAGLARVGNSVAAEVWLQTPDGAAILAQILAIVFAQVALFRTIGRTLNFAVAAERAVGAVLLATAIKGVVVLRCAATGSVGQCSVATVALFAIGGDAIATMGRAS